MHCCEQNNIGANQAKKKETSCAIRGLFFKLETYLDVIDES